MIAVPFFSDKDSQLLRQGSVRDYLGLVPVWSKIARKLEPNLSGSINSYLGLEAVLFIYYLEKEYRSDSSKQSHTFRKFFRYMEALIEYHFFHGLNKSPCYGSRILKGNGVDVEIKLSSATVVNGLFQFYRGTCRRAGMISNDWVLNEAAESTIKSICTSHSSGANNLIKFIDSKILSKNKAIKPSEIFEDKQVVELFNGLFKSKDLKTFIKDCLYVDSGLEYYAKACSTVKSKRQSENDVSLMNLAQHLETFISTDNKDWPYFTELNHVTKSEPFLSLLDDCFQLLHIHNGLKLTELVALLAEPSVKQVMKAKAVDFKCALSGSGDHDSGRIKKLLDMASYLAEEDVKTFLLALLDYHLSIMNSRYAGAMVLEEGGKLHVTSEIHSANIKQLVESIRDKNPWKNGYYINTSARIYNQLHGAT